MTWNSLGVQFPDRPGCLRSQKSAASILAEPIVGGSRLRPAKEQCGSRQPGSRDTLSPGRLPAAESKKAASMSGEEPQINDSMRVWGMKLGTRLELSFSSLHRGDSVAWTDLFRAHHRRVYSLCYRFTGNPQDSEDLTQDVFLKIYGNLGSFESTRGSFQVWIAA